MKEDVFQLGVKALLQNSDGKLLLLKVDTSKYLEPMPEFWDIPGGRVQKGESVMQTLEREVAEEIGVPASALVDPVKLDVVLANKRIPSEIPGEDFGLLLAIYLYKVTILPDLRLSAEHSAAEWFSARQAAKLLAVKYPADFCARIGRLM
jgi:8-oxo-dGTP pyrophosphatase MutT (NUDIX family)